MHYDFFLLCFEEEQLCLGQCIYENESPRIFGYGGGLLVIKKKKKEKKESLVPS